jgi:recombination protein RecT
MGKELAERPSTSLGQIKAYLNNETIKQRFADMLGKRSSAFTNSLVNVVRNNKQLQKCTPDSIMSAAIIPATLNLSIEPALGHGYIIGYKDTATFQIGYKGLVQLCIRSGQYATIHCSEIYRDELKSHNPITGQVKFKDSSTFKMRSEGSDKNVIGHYAYFKLTSGFEKAEYMSVAEVMAHAKKFSQAYQYDLRAGKKSSPWSIYPIPMGNKTVLKRLLSRFGIMSVEMQDVIVQDNSFEAVEESAKKRIESEQGSEPVDVEFEQPAPEGQLTPQQKAARTRAANKQKKALKEAAAKDKTEFLYACKGCGCGFDEPKTSGTGANAVPICPHCLGKEIVSTEDEKSRPDFMQDDAA